MVSAPPMSSLRRAAPLSSRIQAAWNLAFFFWKSSRLGVVSQTRYHIWPKSSRGVEPLVDGHPPDKRRDPAEVLARAAVYNRCTLSSGPGQAFRPPRDGADPLKITPNGPGGPSAGSTLPRQPPGSPPAADVGAAAGAAGASAATGAIAMTAASPRMNA